jgi:hypothetical protein
MECRVKGGYNHNPRTGEIAMETFPTFNPNKPEQQRVQRFFKPTS